MRSKDAQKQLARTSLLFSENRGVFLSFLVFTGMIGRSLSHLLFHTKDVFLMKYVAVSVRNEMEQLCHCKGVGMGVSTGRLKCCQIVHTHFASLAENFHRFFHDDSNGTSSETQRQLSRRPKISHRP